MSLNGSSGIPPPLHVPSPKVLGSMRQAGSGRYASAAALKQTQVGSAPRPLCACA